MLILLNFKGQVMNLHLKNRLKFEKPHLACTLKNIGCRDLHLQGMVELVVE